jgi:anaerobic ribonucleoside-triphosphate reductase
MAGQYIYAIGNAAEMTGGYDNTLYKVSLTDSSVTATSLSKTDAAQVGNPYGICVNIESGDIYIADADYTGPGKVWCFTKDLKKKWVAVAGMLPAHMVIY